MRQPLWLFNSALFFLTLFILVFMFFSRVTIEDREIIEPDLTGVSHARKVSKISLEKIYERDLFKTYRRELPQIKEPTYVKPMPEPPRPADVQAPKADIAPFFDPLAITLKGIMTMTDGSFGTAIIADNKTKREAAYQVGDIIEDAQLIRIFNDKVIFVRSNGQQEVFYLREQDAQSDPMFLNIGDWKDVIKKFKANNRYISPAMFARRVKNLAQLIDMLNITSAYEKGESKGCRVGKIAAGSLGEELGFMTGDVIKKINDMHTKTTVDRLKIYKDITRMKPGDSIKVYLERAREPYELYYLLKEFKPVQKEGVTLSPKLLEGERKKMLEKKYKFAPTAKEMRMREKRNMLRRGGRLKKPKENKIIE